MSKPPKKQATKPGARYSPRRTVPVNAGETNEETGRNLARLATSPEYSALRAINASECKSTMASDIDLPTMLEVLRDQAAVVNRGDLARVEAMLMNQATALQVLHSRLIERAMNCDHIPGFDANMRMALRAQSQCRATLETLAEIKNPPIVYARQANVTTGPQQVNNGVVAVSRARETESEQTQLSGETNELLPDARASGDPSRANSALETLGEIDRAKIERR